MELGHIAQSVACVTQEPEVRPHTFVSPSADSRRVVVSYWRKNMHEVLVNCLGGLSLPRKCVGRLTDHPNMVTLDVKEQHNNKTKTKYGICL